MHQVYLGLGSNIDPVQNLDAGLSELANHYECFSLSNIYRSSALGFSGPDFLNLVLGVKVDVELEQLSHHLKSLEYAFGRNAKTKKYSSRKLDIDILTFDDYQGVYDAIVLPRPEIRFNAYVLRPFAEIAPGFTLPGMSRTLTALWREYDHDSQPLYLESLSELQSGSEFATRFTGFSRFDSGRNQMSGH